MRMDMFLLSSLKLTVGPLKIGLFCPKSRKTHILTSENLRGVYVVFISISTKATPGFIHPSRLLWIMEGRPSFQKKQQKLSHEKNPGWLGYTGD